MAKAARLNLAEGWIVVAEGQPQLLSAAKKRRAEQTCEPRHSPTRPIIHEGFNPHFVSLRKAMPLCAGF
ncbi:hypothetical protein SGRA_1611 [Saprospira grandis str. Lewin]|uniref:Uncharacterized protein n=1 Tax=Saprospira grandis (strain Lewin) TaxID=984262 RepID=H6L9Y3_SAPGL|nr:hypothetical protein SGRA_1611 [Saprospira grandis str. Lewin]